MKDKGLLTLTEHVKGDVVFAVETFPAWLYLSPEQAERMAEDLQQYAGAARKYREEHPLPASTKDS